MSGADFDIILYGATGFTGQLSAEYLARVAGANISYAVAGRSQARLETLGETLAQAGAYLPKARLVVDGGDLEGLRAMVRRTRVVLTAAGPYPLYGSKLFQACAEEGTHYVDITGDMIWVRQMLDAHQKTAQRTGAKLVISAGFDSLVHDLGAVIALEALGQPTPSGGFDAIRVTAAMTGMRGTMSYGTAYSGMYAAGYVERGEVPANWTSDPYIIVPETSCHVDSSISGWGQFRYDRAIGAFGFPGVMSGVISHVVRRTQYLLGRHGVSYGDGMTLGTLLDAMGFLFAWGKEALVKPEKSGDGPSLGIQHAGGFDVVLVAEDLVSKASVALTIKGRGDPGYRHTSKLLVEMGLCLLDTSCHRAGIGGGVLTPASAASTQGLRDRLGSAKHDDGLPLLTYTFMDHAGASPGREL